VRPSEEKKGRSNHAPELWYYMGYFGILQKQKALQIQTLQGFRAL